MSIQPMDWSATAAWIALAISITGSIAGPIITTILTNRYQLKLRKLDYQQKRIDELNSARTQAITAFISDTGKCLVCPDASARHSCGYSYHNVYAFVPESLWPQLDNLYSCICGHDWETAIELFPAIAIIVTIIKQTIFSISVGVSIFLTSLSFVLMRS